MNHEFARLVAEAFSSLVLIGFVVAGGLALGLVIGFAFSSLRRPSSPRPPSRSEPSKPSDYPAGGEGF